VVLGIRALNLRDLRIEILELVGDFVIRGTATAGGSNTLTDTKRLTFPNSDDLNSFWLYLDTGTGIGQERNITSGPASNVLTVQYNWATTPDTTSQYIVTRRFPASVVDRAIDAAIIRWADRVSQPLEDHSLAGDNIWNDLDDPANIASTGRQKNWQFDFWDTANVPNDWSLTNANSDEEETAFVLGGLRRVLKLQNTGSSAGSASLTVDNWRKYVGRRVRAYGIVNSGAASRAFVRIADGVANTDSDNHTGDESWDRLATAWRTIPAAATQLIVSHQIVSGGQITDYRGPIFLIHGDPLEEYIIPQNFTVIEAVEIESTDFRNFGQYHEIPRDDWDILQGSQLNVRIRDTSGRGQDSTGHPRIRFKRSLPHPARIRLIGRGVTQLIAPTASTEGGVGSTNYDAISPIVAPELIKFSAALVLNQQIPRGAQVVGSNFLFDQEQRALRQATTRMPAGGRRVRSS
jgi:hypothetical protein